jgi:hypothetical protein
MLCRFISPHTPALSTRLHAPPGGHSSMGSGFSWGPDPAPAPRGRAQVQAQVNCDENHFFALVFIHNDYNGLLSHRAAYFSANHADGLIGIQWRGGLPIQPRVCEGTSAAVSVCAAALVCPVRRRDWASERSGVSSVQGLW